MLRSNRKRQPVLLWTGLIIGLLCTHPEIVQASSAGFSGPGPFVVSKSTVPDQGLLFTPSTDAAENRKWPAVVFAHGLCGPTVRYSETLERIASWGFIVLANEKQGDCGEKMTVSHPLSAMKNFFSMPFKVGEALDFSAMAKNVESNIAYLIERDDVDPDALALMGHSMGGGIVIDVAAHLAASRPDRVKAVIAIAPWNGVDPRPSSVVSEVTAPILIFCSMSDLLCPCSGPATITDTQGPFTGPASLSFPMLFGPGSDATWHGGAMAIFDHANNATVVDVKSVSHFTIVGIDQGRQMQSLAEWASDISGLNFNKPERPYRDIPTAEYSVAFLNLAFKLDLSRSEAKMRRAGSDSRISQVNTSK